VHSFDFFKGILRYFIILPLTVDTSRQTSIVRDVAVRSNKSN